MPGNYILQSAFSSGAYSGVDCLDDGTIVDSGQGGSASIIQYTAAEITTTVKWYIDFDGDGYGSSGFEADDAAPQDGVLDDLASQSVTIFMQTVALQFRRSASPPSQRSQSMGRPIPMCLTQMTAMTLRHSRTLRTKPTRPASRIQRWSGTLMRTLTLMV